MAASRTWYPCHLCAWFFFCSGGFLAVSEQCDWLIREETSDYEGVCLNPEGGPRSPACTECLVGEEWDSLRDKFHTSHLRKIRQQPLLLAMNNWRSHQLITTAMRIISEEILGYNVSVFVSNYTRRLEEVTACGALNLESWGGGPLAAKDVVDSREGGILLERELGVTGVEGLYVPQEVPVSARYYELLQQNAPVAVEVTQGTEGVDTGDKKNNVLDFFPLNGTLHNLLLMERVREVDVNCSATVGSDWAEYLCSDDHWVPPQCEGAHPPCRELYLGDPDWSSGEFEAVIRNKNLSFTIHYLGPKGVEHVIANYPKIPGLENGIVYY
mmetsp:Transcript_4613/g.11178  ORF Transcript_4613/g.11178 Transcript_4613/m.11178 type:complete len:327 (-) Transcript_4613:1144-2124(-)